MPITVYKRGKIYHYRGTVTGKRVRGSCGTADKKTAQRFAAELEAEIWKGDFDGPGSTLTFIGAADLYRKAGKQGRFLKALEGHWKDTFIKDITSGAVQTAAITLYPKRSAATRNRHVIVPTQAVINHAASLDLCHPLRVKRFPEDTKIKRPVTWAWIKAFMARANPHMGALACFMFMTGARISEALDVKWEDVDLAERRVLIRQTKVGAERRPHMPPELVLAVANIEGEREPKGKVFKYSSRHTADPQWEAVIKRAKIERLTFHSCRHGFATTLLHRGVDPVTVAKLGGWSSAQHVFETYGHAMEDDTLANLLSEAELTQPGRRSTLSVVKSNS